MALAKSLDREVDQLIKAIARRHRWQRIQKAWAVTWPVLLMLASVLFLYWLTTAQGFAFLDYVDGIQKVGPR